MSLLFATTPTPTGPVKERQIHILCLDTSVVGRKMGLHALISGHRAVTPGSDVVLFLHHHSSYDEVDTAKAADYRVDVVIVDASVCRGRQGVVSHIKTNHPDCIVVGTVQGGGNVLGLGGSSRFRRRGRGYGVVQAPRAASAAVAGTGRVADEMRTRI